MTQQNLESFMLMAIERDVLNNVDLDGIIKRIAEKSKLICDMFIPYV